MSATRSFVGLLAVVLLASLAHAGQIAVEGQPTATMTADGIPYDVPLIYEQATGYWEVGYYDDFGNLVEGYTIERPGEWNCHIEGELNPDPIISYSVAVTDFGVPSSFSFSFSTPIVATGPTTIVDGSIVGSIRDATGNGVTITPTMADIDGDGMLEIQIDSISTGGPLTNMGVDVGLLETHGAGPAGTVFPYGSHAGGPQSGPAGTFTMLHSTASFMLSGGSDSAALTGFAQVVIPEPSSVALAAMGALLLVGYAIRRRKA